jgi:hypothetical protein
MPKWHRRIAGIKALIAIDADLAAETMFRLRGTGAAARHWLRGTPPALLTDAVRSLLRTCDNQWVDLWVALAGHDPALIDADTRARLSATVFGPLHQEASAAMADYEAAVGMRAAFVDVITTAHDRNMDPRPWGPVLHLDALANAPSPDLSPQVVGECARVLNQRVEALTPHHTTAHADTTLWVAAFGNPGSLRSRVDALAANRPSAALAYAATRALGLPIWPLLAGDTRATGPPA